MGSPRVRRTDRPRMGRFRHLAPAHQTGGRRTAEVNAATPSRPATVRRDLRAGPRLVSDTSTSSAHVTSDPPSGRCHRGSGVPRNRERGGTTRRDRHADQGGDLASDASSKQMRPSHMRCPPRPPGGARARRTHTLSAAEPGRRRGLGNRRGAFDLSDQSATQPAIPRRQP